MSERRSWDVQPKRREVSRPAPQRSTQAPKRAPQPIEPVRQAPKPKAAPQPVRAAQPPRKPAPLPSGTLKERRKKQRTVFRYVLICALFFAFMAAMYTLWLPALRVQAVTAHGPEAEVAKTITQKQLEGTYLYLLPRNSIFFLPKDKIRASILDAAPGVVAVSITRTTFSSIEIGTTPRAASFIWCGTSIDAPIQDGTCYDVDIEGLIFAAQPPVELATTTATTTLTTHTHLPTQIRIFSPLDRELQEGQSPLRAHIAGSARIPNALKFVDAVRQLGAPVSSLTIRGDEADLWLGGPTRITYVLGHEQEAADLAASALPSLNLKNGTIQYVDLRFPGKAYVKRYGDSSE